LISGIKNIRVVRKSGATCVWGQ